MAAAASLENFTALPEGAQFFTTVVRAGWLVPGGCLDDLTDAAFALSLQDG